jgi:N-acetylglucosamine repressor
MDKTKDRSTFGGDSPSLLKRKNLLDVLAVIQQKNRISRAELARITRLTPATVSSTAAELGRLGLVREIGHGKSMGGRRPILIELNPEAFYLMGVDVGITKVIALITDLHGGVLSKTRLEVDVQAGKEHILSRVREAAERTLAAVGDRVRKKVSAMGVAVPGLVDIEKNISVFAPNLPDWKSVPIGEILTKEFTLPVFVENDARAMALGETRYGAAVGYDNILCLNVGHGIGSGIIVNGEVYRGKAWAAGEIGHSTIITSGPLCHCGNRGCLEVMAGGHAIAASAIRVISTGVKTAMRDLIGGDITRITAKVVSDAAQAGDAAAGDLLREAGTYIGIGLANAVNLLAPEVIVIGGGVALSGEILFAEIRKTVKARAFTTMVSDPPIVPSVLGENASGIGVCALALGRILTGKEPVLVNGPED